MLVKDLAVRGSNSIYVLVLFDILNTSGESEYPLVLLPSWVVKFLVCLHSLLHAHPLIFVIHRLVQTRASPSGGRP